MHLMIIPYETVDSCGEKSASLSIYLPLDDSNKVAGLKWSKLVLRVFKQFETGIV